MSYDPFKEPTSAVEWQFRRVLNHVEGLKRGYVNADEFLQGLYEIRDEALAMEKEQIIEAFDYGDYCIDLPDGTWEQKYKSPEEYYKERYGSFTETTVLKCTKCNKEEYYVTIHL